MIAQKKFNFCKQKQKEFRRLRLFIALPLIILFSTLALFSFTADANSFKVIQNDKNFKHSSRSLSIEQTKSNRSEQWNYVTSTLAPSSTNSYSKIVSRKILFLEFDCKV